MAKTVNATNVAHALNVRQAIRKAVGQKWPELNATANAIQRNAVVGDCVAIYNAQMIAHAVGTNSAAISDAADTVSSTNF